MSECVVRMTLPKACVWRDDKGNIKMCPLYWEDEARCQGKDGKKAPWYDGKRPDWCPIICQLPEGHGRLVDERELFARCRPVKNFDNPDSPVIVMGAIIQSQTIVPAEAESLSHKPADPLSIRGVEYVMTECDAKTGTVKYELRERIEL